MASNWDRIFGSVRTELSEADIARAQRTSDRTYAKVLDRQVKSDPLYKATKPHPLTRLALRDLEMAKAAEARVPEQLAAYGQTTPFDIQSEYDLRDPQQQVNAAVDALRDVDPRTTRMLRDYKAGVRSVGDAPMGAVAENPVRTARDAALSGLSFMNPVEWFGGYGYGDIRDRMQELERKGLSAEDLGREAGRSDMLDTATMATMAPGMVRGLGQLGTGALNLGTKGLRSLHQRLNTIPEARRLENISDINPGASTFSGRTFDPASRAQAARKAAMLSGAAGAGAMGASDDAGATSWFKELIEQASKNQTTLAKWIGKTPSEAGLKRLSARRTSMLPRAEYDRELEDAIRIYKMSGYGALNQLQRTGKVPRAAKEMYSENVNNSGLIPLTLEEVQRKLAEATSGPLRLKDETLPIYRGSEFVRSSQGAELFGNGFGSFSYAPNTAAEFVGGEVPSRIGAISRIRQGDGLRGLDISDNRFLPDAGMGIENEYELLLAPNQGFRVSDAAVDEQKRLLLDLKYAPDVQSGVHLYAGGGLVKSGLKMMFPNLAAPMHVVKPKGGNWLNNSVEDALRGLRRAPGVEREGVETFSGMTDRAIEDAKRTFVMDDWVTGPLTKYVKTRMASPEDEVRRLAEEGVLHYDPAVMPRYMDDVWGRRELTGNPASMGTAPLAQKWEAYADQMVRPRRMGDKWRSSGTGEATTRDIVAGDPGGEWATNAADDAMVYQLRRPGTSSAAQVTDELGFAHLVDELSNALDPNSGLPRHLQLTPEAVKNLSMEKAVRRVADINAWRAAQKIEASQKIAGGPGQELVREYAHTPEKPNPKGLRWVELKKPEQMPEGWADMTTDGSRFRGPNGAIVGASNDPRIEELSKQLKYEGDTMGHCVGGYCDDVVSGRSRIFSLRGANGEPHVTVEVGKAKHPDDADLYFDLPEAKQEEFMDLGHGEAVRRGIEEGSDEYMQAVNEHASALGRQWIAEQHARLKDTPVILQIKGKQNRKPNDEYLPFVQDFVKNPPHGAPWGEVGDLQNSGLRSMGELEVSGVSPAKLQLLQQRHGRPYFSVDELEQEVPRIRDLLGGKYASGGSVSATLGGWEALTDPTGSPAENKLSWDIFSGHNDPEQLEAVQ